MLSEAKLAEILNRPLTTNESGNYTKLATQAAGHMSLLLCGSTTYEADAERTYEVREGYRTIFTDPFTGTATVTIGGSTTDADKYTLRLGDAIVGGSGVKNAVVFKKHLTRGTELVTIRANFGFNDTTMPVELQGMFADLFVKADRDAASIGQRAVKSKRIDDYSVTYADEDVDTFKASYAAVLSKYAACGSGAVRHGTVRPFYYN